MAVSWAECWPQSWQVLDADVEGVHHGHARVHVLIGGWGQGLRPLVESLAERAGERTLVRILDDVESGAARAYVNVGREESGTGAGAFTLEEARAMTAAFPEGRRLVVIESVLALGPEQSRCLLEWVSRDRFHDVVWLVALPPHMVVSDIGRALCALPNAVVSRFGSIEPEEMATWLVRSRGLSAAAAAAVARQSLGLPYVALRLGEYVAGSRLGEGAGAGAAGDEAPRQDSVEDDPLLAEALDGVLAEAAGELAAISTEEERVLALGAVLLDPVAHGDDLASVFAVPLQSAQRALALVRGHGLVGGDDARGRAATRALVAVLTPPQTIAAATAVLPVLQRPGACPRRVLTVMELLGWEPTTCRDAAEQVFALALGAGDHASALELAGGVLRSSPDPGCRAWARRAALSVAVGHDWAATTRMLRGAPAADESVRDLVLDAGLSTVYSLEAPGAVREALQDGSGGPGAAVSGHQLERLSQHALVSGDPRVSPGVPARHAAEAELRAIHVMVRALRGRPAEGDWRRLRDGLTARQGLFDINAHTAVWMAAAGLCLADHDNAAWWSSHALLVAEDGDQGLRGFGHVLLALTRIRQGAVEDAALHGALARERFAELRAPRLERLGVAVICHARVEGGTDTDADPGPSPPEHGGHPLVDAYIDYVRARARLARGDAAAAVSELFAVGRTLQRHGWHNPTLMNWRPHLARAFQAAGERQYASMVEDDMVRSMRAWARGNPDSARARSTILGARAGELFDVSSGPARASEETLGEEARGALSGAEMRVVRQVALGLSNREVARELYLSKRTVDTHLSHVYRKLGIGSRRELLDRLGASAHVPAPVAGGGPSVIYG